MKNGAAAPFFLRSPAPAVGRLDDASSHVPVATAAASGAEKAFGFNRKGM
jgi:hypothetical protein